jgi:glycosyltransferase involved in cell wall biosynthesis
VHAAEPRAPGGATAPCSVVIRAFNEEKHIGRLLSGILQQSVRPERIILVDSGSSDATLSIAAQYPVHVEHIRPEEFSFGRSLNRGLAAAQGEFAVLASAHVYPIYADWLEQLLRPLDDPQVALSYGRQQGNAATRFSEHQVLAKWFPARSAARQGHPFCNNANAALRLTRWREHPYDEELPGLEDVAWATWAMAQGHAVAYVAEAPVVHVHEESPRMVYNRYRREAMAFKRIHPEAHFSIYDFARLALTNILSDVWHAARDGELWRSLPSILWFRLMQFHGTRMGHRETGLVTPQLRETFYYARGRNRAPAAPREVEPIRYDPGG